MKHGYANVIAGDTAGSAREVREWNDPAKLSLAPLLAAQIYGLEVLASRVEDDPSSTTRFVVLAREAELPQYELPGSAVTSFVFRVRNVPSALYKALGGFARPQTILCKGGSNTACSDQRRLLGRKRNASSGTSLAGRRPRTLRLAAAAPLGDPNPQETWWR